MSSQLARRLRIILLFIVLLAICGAMFYAGLRPRGFRLRNDVAWLAPENGIRFGRIGIAFTKEPADLAAPTPDGLSIELVVKVPIQNYRRLTSILCLWDDRAGVIFELCQWRQTLIGLRRKTGFFKDTETDFGGSVEPGKTHVVVITSRNGQGTILYADGRRAGSTGAFSISDDRESLGRLVLGNSATGRQSWRGGEILALSIHAEAFTQDAVLGRYRQWEETRVLPYSPTAAASYSFDEGGGTVAHDRAGKFGDLSIPFLFHIPDKQALSPPWKDFNLGRSFVRDALMNTIGFMPFGFFFLGLMRVLGGSLRRRALALTLAFGAAISLGFELIQAYLPTRASQMSDLILNVLGTLAGALAAKLLFRARASS
jgi:hypothetical protein